MKTVITALIGITVAWLRERGIIDLTKEQEEALAITIGLLVAIFMRLGILKAEKVAKGAQVIAEGAREAALEARAAATGAERAAVGAEVAATEVQVAVAEAVMPNMVAPRSKDARED